LLQQERGIVFEAIADAEFDERAVRRADPAEDFADRAVFAALREDLMLVLEKALVVLEARCLVELEAKSRALDLRKAELGVEAPQFSAYGAPDPVADTRHFVSEPTRGSSRRACADSIRDERASIRMRRIAARKST